MKKTIKKPWFIILMVICISAVIWLSSLIKCEILTQKYYDDFENAFASNTMLGDMEYFKVLSCNDKTAEVYYVSKDMTDANILTFEKRDGAWVDKSWETIWSTSGSASEIIYPYWWHFIYGAF